VIIIYYAGCSVFLTAVSVVTSFADTKGKVMFWYTFILLSYILIGAYTVGPTYC